jgi:hypothetical protein
MGDSIKHDVKISDNCIMRLRNNIVSGYWSIFYYNSNGDFHNLYGPSINHNNRTKMWYINGIRHRENQPAFISSLGELWYYYGKLHRINGPAIINIEMGNRYYIHDKIFSKEKYNKIMFIIKRFIILLKKPIRNKYSIKLLDINVSTTRDVTDIISSYII